MLNQQSHIIKKQVLDIHTDTEKDVWQLQNRIRSIYYEKMLPLIEEACDNYDSDEIVRIDHLTIDLGEISLKKMDEQIVRAFESKINEQLSKIIFQSKTGSTSENVKVEKISRPISDFELLTTFLKAGVLPWWKKNLTGAEIETIFVQQIQKNSNAVKLFLANHIGFESILKRITFQFSEKTIKKLIVLNAGNKGEKLEQLLSDLKTIFSQLVKQKKLAPNDLMVFTQELIRISVENSQNSTNEKYVLQELLDSFNQRGIQSKEVLIKSIFKIVRAGNYGKSQKKYSTALLMASEILLREIAPHSEIEIIRDLENLKGNSGQKKKLVDTQKEDFENSETKKINQPESESKEDPAEKAKDKSVFVDEKKSEQKDNRKKLKPEFNLETVEEVYIKNAGLVLVWNYLPFYFKHVGLVVGGEFKDEEAKHRAAHLLQFIVTGEESSSEYELPLNKLLCGISLTEPLEKSIVVTEEEKAEAEVMLQTAIKHWGALGQTSSLALRQSFLNREGMLTKDHKSWVLRVEESAIDILLDKLPWSYSIINFKWMEKPIYVEWR